ncbi:alpha/beta hydrolase [Actinoplanes sp. TBRC 11911]|uniref:poly(ethylene terephthalate) hydrolase family protein n=1 Tax=Actinoplanes sp. TBRC 11911 TaxID=2729386 RepID=UPI00145E0E49|nr:dienelactone hydrolase family protein [Actinoplanes sp. TBRC 11911]NMO54731.1 alpha/beta hydrolase [Actinoplanes sp. TBRC 11911]
MPQRRTRRPTSRYSPARSRSPAAGASCRPPVWYPARPAGRRPVILFSHGLGGLPEHFAALTEAWAAAGYVVVAPAYPHTNALVDVRREDVGNQPADAAYVLREVATNGPLAEHVDAGRIAVIGFSAGGTTTLGLLGRGHDPGIKAAICIAGRAPDEPMGGPAVATLFLHGDDDPVVPIAAGRAAYEQVPWPTKRFVTIRHEGHGQYLHPDNPAYGRTQAMILEFLRAEVGQYAR